MARPCALPLRAARTLSTQVDDGLGEDFGRGELIRDAGVLVRPVHVAVEAGHGAAEGHAAGDVVDVGAAADGQALPLVAGVALVAGEQGLDEGAVRRGVVGGLHLPLGGKAGSGEGGLRDLPAVGLVGAEGDPAVELAGQAGGASLQQGEGQGQGAGDLIRLGHPQGAALGVPMGEEGVQGPEGGGGLRVGQGQGGQQGQQGGDGVASLRRGGGVGPGPVAEDAQAGPLLPQLEGGPGLPGGLPLGYDVLKGQPLTDNTAAQPLTIDYGEATSGNTAILTDYFFPPVSSSPIEGTLKVGAAEQTLSLGSEDIVANYTTNITLNLNI